MTTTTGRRFTATIAALSLAAALGACSASDPAELTAGRSSSTEEVTGTTGHNDGDTQFAQMMIVHHEGAVEMAGLAVERASDDRVRSLAERIAAAQGPEIQLMSGWLDAWGEDLSADPDHGGMDHGAMDMHGMDQDEAMASLSELDDAQFDRRFLELMVAHHRGAIEMAEKNLRDGQNAQVRDLARTIIDDQTNEIAEMDTLLQNR